MNIYINRNAVRRAVKAAVESGLIQPTDFVAVHSVSQKQDDGSVERGLAAYVSRGTNRGAYL